MDVQTRRKAFGQFLRSKREKLTPALVGVHHKSRRRTPGLRREEVAELVGISAAWYTYLEQGRDVQPSPDVLRCIAKVLRLTQIEYEYLCALALPNAYNHHVADEVPASVQRLLATLHTQPAYVTGHAWDLLAWNHAACQLFTNFGAIPKHDRNLVRYMFTNVQLRHMFLNWEEHARHLVAQFRTRLHMQMGEPCLIGVLCEMLMLSSDFAEWWETPEVDAKQAGVKHFLHPQAGPLQLEYNALHPNGDPHLTLMIYTAVDTISEKHLSKIIS